MIDFMLYITREKQLNAHRIKTESPEIDGIISSLNLRSAPRNIACIALTYP